MISLVWSKQEALAQRWTNQQADSAESRGGRHQNLGFRPGTKSPLYLSAARHWALLGQARGLPEGRTLCGAALPFFPRLLEPSD